MLFKALRTNFVENKDNQVLCQLAVKPKANVSSQLNFRLFVSCRLKFWPFVSCQLSVNPIQTLYHGCIKVIIFVF